MTRITTSFFFFWTLNPNFLRCGQLHVDSRNHIFNIQLIVFWPHFVYQQIYGSLVYCFWLKAFSNSYNLKSDYQHSAKVNFVFGDFQQFFFKKTVERVISAEILSGIIFLYKPVSQQNLVALAKRFAQRYQIFKKMHPAQIFPSFFLKIDGSHHSEIQWMLVLKTLSHLSLSNGWQNFSWMQLYLRILRRITSSSYCYWLLSGHIALIVYENSSS